MWSLNSRGFVGFIKLRLATHLNNYVNDTYFKMHGLKDLRRSNAWAILDSYNLSLCYYVWNAL